MNNRAMVIIAAVVLALALAWYAVPLPDGPPAEPPAATAPVIQPAPAPEATPATPATPPTETPKQ